MKERSFSLIKNTSILSFGTLCTKGIMFFMTPLFTRWLTTEEYGTFDLMVTYISLSLPIVTLAMGEALFRFLLDETDSLHREKIISTAAFTEFVGVVFSVFAVLSFLIYTRKFNAVAVAFLVYFVCEIGYNFFMMLLRGIKQLRVYAIGNILFVLGLAIFVSVFVKGMKLGLVGILLGYAAGDILSILFMVVVSNVYKGIGFRYVDKSYLKRMIRYSLPMIPNGISWWIVNASDRTIISLVLGTGVNAIYAVANKIPSLCTTFFSVFHISWQQSATEALADKDRDQYYTSVMNNMLWGFSSIGILVLGINYWFFKLLFSEDYFPGRVQAPILTLAVLWSMLAQFIGGIYVAQKRSKENGITTLSAAVINIVINVLLIDKIGLYAASISTLMAYMILFIIRYIDIRRSVKLLFNKKGIKALLLLLCFFGGAYCMLDWFQIIQFCLAVIVFILMNAKYCVEILKKISQKMNG